MNQIGSLLYISGYYLDGNHGSTEHVREVASHLAHLGWQVTLVGLAKDHLSSIGKENATSPVTVVPIHSQQARSNFLAFSFWRKVAQLVRQHDFDLAYIRPARKTVFAARWLKQVGVPYFVEVNTNTAGEYRAMGASRIVVTLANWLERVQFSQAAGAFCMTRELAEYVRDRIPRDAEVWITGNGFRSEITALGAFNDEPRRSLGISEQQTVVTFLGSLQPWHGTDLLLEALKYSPETRLWIIGDGPENLRLKAQASQLGIEDRIHWWGHQDGAYLQMLLSASDIAIGSLALHRNNMYEAQPLKVRHYLGVGLPTIIGYNDTLLGENSPGVFCAGTPEEIAERIKEIRRWGHARSIEYRQEVREFALQHLSWAAIARQTSDILLGWLNSVRHDSYHGNSVPAR